MPYRNAVLNLSFPGILMTIIGYWRASDNEKDIECQVMALGKAYCQRIYGDKINGMNSYSERPQLAKCLQELNSGDLFITKELSRLGRSMVEMLVCVNALIERGAYIKTLDGRLDTSLMPKEMVWLIFSTMGYAAEMELKNIQSRAAEGRAFAKAEGVKFGRKKTYDDHQVAKVMEKRSQGQGYGTIARSLGMSRSMVQRIVQREEIAA